MASVASTSGRQRSRLTTDSAALTGPAPDASRRHRTVWEYGMMSTTRGNDGRGTPGGWVTAAGRGLAAVITGLILALTGASLASAQ